MTRLFGRTRKVRALACQADEDETTAIQENGSADDGSEADDSQKGRLSRPRNALKCLFPLAVLRGEIRVDGSPKGESCEHHGEYSRAKYFMVVEEKEPSEVSDGNEGRPLLNGDRIENGPKLTDEACDSTGSLKAVQEGNEFEEECEPGKVSEKAIPQCSSPTTQTTDKSDLSSQPLVSPFDIALFDEPIFKAETDEQKLPSRTVQNEDTLIEIQPLSLEPPQQRASKFSKRSRRNTIPNRAWATNVFSEPAALAETTKPDPPALMVSDSNFHYEHAMSRFAPISIASKRDCDRTVISELTCDSFSGIVAPHPHQPASIEPRENVPTELLEDGEESGLPSSRSVLLLSLPEQAEDEAREIVPTERNKNGEESELGSTRSILPLSVPEQSQEEVLEIFPTERNKSREECKVRLTRSIVTEQSEEEAREIVPTEQNKSREESDRRSTRSIVPLSVTEHLEEEAREIVPIEQTKKRQESQLRSTRPPKSSRKIQELISKFETLAISKVTLASVSNVSKQQLEDETSSSSSS